MESAEPLVLAASLPYTLSRNVNTNAVLNALRLGIAASEPPPPRRADTPPWLPQGGIRIHPAVLAAIVAALQDQLDLAIFDDHMQQFGNHARRVSLTELAEWLIKQSHAIGPEQVVADLDRYIREDRYPVEESCLLAGITVAEEVQILDGIRLLPFDQLPDSRYKQMFTPTWWHSFATAPTQPTSVLVCENLHLKQHAGGASPTMAFQPMRYAEMNDVRLILTLIGPCTPIHLAFWSIPARWVPLGDTNLGWSGPVEQGHIIRPATLVPADVDRLRDLYSRFTRLTADNRQHLRVPLERLNRALRRSDWTDSAIESGIALEALFLNDQGGEQGELTFRLRVRGARFLGETIDDRVQIDRLLRNVYRLRSAAVHKGRVPDRLDNTPTGELLEQGYRLTAQAIEQVIRQGGNPDWSQITLG